jgi:hypothetical protein
MRNGGVDPIGPDEAQVAPTGLHWQYGVRHTRYAGSMAVQLAVAKSIREPGAYRDDFRAKDIMVEAIGSFPARHVNHAMIKDHRVHDSNLLRSVILR